MCEQIYEINPNVCTEFVGHFDIPQCVDICPIDCIPKDENNVETDDQLYQKYLQLSKKEPK